MLRINGTVAIKYWGFLCVYFIPATLGASHYHGRLNLGVFASKEKFAQESGGSSSNDSLLYSARFFLNVSDISSAGLESVVDIRDKYDVFGHLNEKDYTLEPQNEYQARQLAIKYPNSEGSVYATAGRFPAMDAGVNYIDGGELGFRIGENLRLGGFGGYDPAAANAYGLTFSRENKIAGAYGVLQSSGFKLTKNFYSATALISQENSIGAQESAEISGGTATPATAPTTEKTQTIQYFYNNTAFQFLGINYLSFVLYYDVKPEKLLRHIWLSDQSELFSWLTLLLSYTKVDYKDPQIAFSTLSQEHSKVEDYSGRLKFKISRNYAVHLRGMQGKRFLDDKKKSDYALGLTSQAFLSHLVGLNVYAGNRQHYTYKEQYLFYELGYFSKSWEIMFNQECANKTWESGQSSKPVLSELGFSSFWSKTLFSTLAIQHQKDVEVSILSALLRIGYRFGTREIPPIRDGAPPMGGI